MSTYIWTIVGVLFFEAALKLICLAAGEIPKRTPATMATDLFIGVCLAVWGIMVVTQ